MLKWNENNNSQFKSINFEKLKPQITVLQQVQYDYFHNINTVVLCNIT